MDDLIYFLLVIGWLAFSFYQHSAKKKRQVQKMQQEASDYEAADNYPYETEEAEYRVPETKSSSEPDFRKVLEEILLGNEIEPQQTKTSHYKPEPRMPEIEAEQEVNVYQQYLKDKGSTGRFASESQIESLEERRAALENEMVIADKSETKRYIADSEIGFDLRKAVIYSEILNRRYAN